ncbi:hypothetical protein [Rothia sp. 32237D007AR]
MVKYTRPLATSFKGAKTKVKLAAMARAIADLADAPRIDASPDKAYTYKVVTTYIYPGGLVYWGKDIPTGMVSYIIRYLEGEGYEPQDITDFPVTITTLDQSISLHREAWAKQHQDNIARSISAKAHLLAAALQVPQSQIRVELAEDTVTCPWFTSSNTTEQIEACQVLLEKVAQNAATSRTLAATSSTEGSAKYAMRCWLIRLGLNGPDYKQVRKTLLANLDGNAAWKTAPTPEAA